MTENQLENQPIEYLGRGHFSPSWVKMGDLLYEIIEARGPITRRQLMKLTGIPWTTLFDCLMKLLNGDQIKRFSGFTRKRGRPAIYYEVKTNGHG